MNKYITIEIDPCNKDYPVRVGNLCAEGVEDAYEQLGADVPRETPETIVIPAFWVNQLIIDLNKAKRRM